MQRFLSCMWSSSMTLVIQSFSGLFVFRSGGSNGLKQGLQIFFFCKEPNRNYFRLYRLKGCIFPYITTLKSKNYVSLWTVKNRQHDRFSNSWSKI